MNIPVSLSSYKSVNGASQLEPHPIGSWEIKNVRLRCHLDLVGETYFKVFFVWRKVVGPLYVETMQRAGEKEHKLEDKAMVQESNKALISSM